MVFGPSYRDFSDLQPFLAETALGREERMSPVSKEPMTRTVEITRREEFSASHRLHDPALSDAENVALYGPCNNPHGHGHNYAIEVSLTGEVPQSGMVMDLNVLHGILHEEITTRVDHKHLNHDVDFLEGLVTTAENLAVAFFERLEVRINDHPGCTLSSVRVYESAANFAEYRGASS
jgi:6-pyruvoyltetrahydropterin/6-carboxytetrahydropterin synthase